MAAGDARAGRQGVSAHARPDASGDDALVLRPVAVTDADAIAALHAASWRVAYRGIMPDAYLDGPVVAERVAHWRGRLSDPGDAFGVVAQRADDVIGFVWVIPDADTQWGALLDNLHVRPGLVRGGVGGRLLVAAAATLEARRPGSAMHLFVFEANVNARAFYRRWGGVEAEHLARPTVDGATAPSWRVAWSNAAAITRR